MKKEVSNKKAVITLIIVALLLIALGMVYANFFANKKENNNNDVVVKKNYSEDIQTIATLEDEITTNSVWCGTFQLVWNDMVNNVVKQNVVFTPKEKIVENLNKPTFKEDQISEKD